MKKTSIKTASKLTPQENPQSSLITITIIIISEFSAQHTPFGNPQTIPFSTLNGMGWVVCWHKAIKFIQNMATTLRFSVHTEKGGWIFVQYAIDL